MMMKKEKVKLKVSFNVLAKGFRKDCHRHAKRERGYTNEEF